MALKGRTSPTLIKGERLDMVLLENHAMWEKLRKCVLEFIELKFVNVERIRA
jgi:hypothetical protein